MKNVFLPQNSVSVLSDWVDSFGLHPITPSTTINGVCTLNLIRWIELGGAEHKYK